MVSFRFHLVSLVAVFMALGLGVLTGTTVINRGIVAQLENQTEGLRVGADRLRADVDRLQGEVETWSAFGEEVTDTLLTGQLNGSRVVVITQDGTDDASIDGVLRSLRMAVSAEEDVIGPLSVSGRMALAEEADRTDLASIVGADPSSDPETLQIQAADQLAERLSFGPPGDETMEQLLAARFLVDEGPELADPILSNLGGGGEVVVVIAGGPATSLLRPERFLVPLVSDLARDGSTVAAAEPVDAQEQEPPFVSLLRADGEVSSVIATQDNVDQMPGQIGLVLAVQDLLRGIPGHYGVKDGASRTIPEV